MKEGNEDFRPTRLTLVAILLCSMMMLMGGAAVAPALPMINEVFPDSSVLVSLIITLPSLSVAIFGFAVGWMADRFGKVRVLSSALAVFVVAGAVSYCLDTIESILLARFILGIGIAGISCTVTALIAEYYSGIDRVRVLSYQSAAMGVGVLILEFTGGSLAELSWREPFLVYLIGLPILLLVVMSMREPGHRDTGGDAVRRISRPVNRGLVMTCYIGIFILMCIAFLMPTKIPYYLEGIGISSSLVGLFLGVHGVSNAAFSIMYGRISSRIGAFTVLSMGFIISGVGLALPTVDGSVYTSVVTLIMTGIGLGLAVPAIVSTLAREVTGANSGKVMGGYSMCLNLGQFSISLISVPLFAAVGSTYPALFLVMGAVALVAGVAFMCVGRRMGADRPSGGLQ